MTCRGVGPTSIFSPISTPAYRINDVAMLVLAVSLVIFVVVSAQHASIIMSSAGSSDGGHYDTD